MSEFEKELNRIPRNGVAEREEGFYLYSNLVRYFKDWQPPKKLVEVPQFVADWFEDSMEGTFAGVISSYAFNDLEAVKWVQGNGGIDLLCRMKLYGYTVEKEQMYYLKNKNTGHILYRQPKEAGGNFIEVVATINEEYTWFTQDEIDTMHIGSYEQIEVDE